MRVKLALVTLSLVASVLAGCFAPDDAPDLTPVEEDADPYGFSMTHVYDGGFDLAADIAQVLEPGLYDVGEVLIFDLESAVDGAPINVALVLPDVPEADRGDGFATIIEASPYYGTWTPERVVESGNFIRYGQQFVPHGYAFALIATRGTGQSGGCIDYNGLDERADLDTAITWIASQDWSNGNVGLIGVSYPGATAWSAAALGNPAVKTIVPTAGMSDYFQLPYRNGTVNSYGYMLEFGGYYAFPRAFGWLGSSPAHYLDQTLCQEGAEVAAAQAYSIATGARDPLGFWAERNMRPAILDSYEGSVFVIHALDDTNVGPSQSLPFATQLADAGIPVKYMLGFWSHNIPIGRDPSGMDDQQERWDMMEILKRWYDRWLKENTTVDLGPVAQTIDTSGQWRSGDAWPPSNANRTVLYLGVDGRLAPEPTSGTDPRVVTPMMIVPDPFARTASPAAYWKEPIASLCPNCPTFSTEPFDEDFRFAGLPKLQISATPTGPGGHLSAWLWSETDEGSTLLAWGGLDMRFADGTEEPKTVVPGVPVDVRLEMEPTDAVVPAGGRLVLTVHQGGYADYPPRVPTYPVTMEAGGDARLIVESFTVEPEQFFTPPRP